MKPHIKILAGAVLAALAMIPGTVAAAPGLPDSDPLIVKGFAKPNIMLLIDTSGSMNNIVPDAPYDPNANYVTCNSGNRLTADSSKTLQVYVRSGGDNKGRTRMRYGSDYYDWGTSSTTALNGLTKRCFDNSATYAAKLYADDNCTVSNTNFYCPSGNWLDADYTGHYLNWYFSTNKSGTPLTTGLGGAMFVDGSGNATRTKPVTGGNTGFAQTRMEVTKISAKGLIDDLSEVRIGLATYDASGDGNGAQIKKGLVDISAANATAMKTSIDGLIATGATPLGESFSDLGRYFVEGNKDADLSLHPNGTPIPKTTATGAQIFDHEPGYDSGTKPVSATDTIQYSCQKSFIVAMTDGRPQSDQSMSKYLKDYDGDCTVGATTYRGANKCVADFTWAADKPYPTSSTFYDQKRSSEGYSYENNGSGFVSDVTAALYDLDLRPDEATMPGKQNVTSYMIGFADVQAQNDPLLNDAAVAGGGKFYTANNADQMLASFRAAAEEIKNTGGTAAAASFSSGKLSADSVVYLAQFNSAKWSGQLLAYRIDPSTGQLTGSPLWDAAEKLNGQLPNNRVILAHDGAKGVPFRWTTTAIDQAGVPLRADLNNGTTNDNTSDSQGSARLNYLRGDRSKEIGTAGGVFRARAGALGDIVSSTPVYVGKPESRWPDTAAFGSATERFSSFITAQAARTPVIYVGANDGMLHGFDASVGGANSGKEVLAYVPSAPASTVVNQGLHFLTDPKYTHRFYVDLSPALADIYINADRTKTDSAANRDWATVLVGGLGRGGMGYYALDVTDPSTFAETNAGRLVLWEFSAKDDSDLGYSYSEPTIAMMNDGRWAAIVGNGYESANGVAALFILFIEEGKSGWSGNYIKISTGVGDAADKNGLSSPQAADLNGDGKVDRIYAGDVHGNMWAFDVSSTDTSKWASAYKSGGNPKPLFSALDANDKRQPITARPLLGRNVDNAVGAAPNVVVMFGTGQYLATTDITDAQAQTFYVVADVGSGNLDRDDLLARSVTSSSGIRSMATGETAEEMDWSKLSGWYLDLNAGTNALGGERVVTQAVLLRRLLLFNTIIPDTTPCKSGGTGWLMSFDFLTGMGKPDGIFDSNGDRKITSADANAVGRFESMGLPTRPSVIDRFRITATSKGDGKNSTTSEELNPGSSDKEGRLGWEEVLPR